MVDSERQEFSLKHEFFKTKSNIESSQKFTKPYQEIELFCKKNIELTKSQFIEKNSKELLDVIEIQKLEIRKLYERIAFLEEQFEKTEKKPNYGTLNVVGHDKYFKNQDISSVSSRNNEFSLLNYKKESSILNFDDFLSSEDGFTKIMKKWSHEMKSVEFSNKTKIVIMKSEEQKTYFDEFHIKKFDFTLINSKFKIIKNIIIRVKTQEGSLKNNKNDKIIL